MTTRFRVNSLQQIGLGTRHMSSSWQWHIEHFGFDIPMVKNDVSQATDMQHMTGNTPQKRAATIAINSSGGAGLEIWQYIDREPEEPAFATLLGDLGIYITKIKALDPKHTYHHLKQRFPECLVSPLFIDSLTGNETFYVRDNVQLLFQVVKAEDFFLKKRQLICGGVYGAVIGVSDLERSISFYRTLLGYDIVVNQESGEIANYHDLPGGQEQFKRALLRSSAKLSGPLSRLLGKNEIELVQVTTREPRRLFENRYWGDIGFIHICYDISDMKQLETYCYDNNISLIAKSNNPLTMEQSSGTFAYAEDPDKTLIEFVEVHRLPVFKRLGLYINLKKYWTKSPLPDFLLKIMFAVTRVKRALNKW